MHHSTSGHLAFLVTQSFARTQAARHTGQTAIVPRGMTMRLTISYAMRRDSPRFRSFLDGWLEVRRAQGYFDQLYAYWVRGRRQAQGRHWSLARDELGWLR